MMLSKMILLGLAHADGLFTHTQNAVNHYKTGYYNRKTGLSGPTDDSFSKYLNFFQALLKRQKPNVYF